MQKIIKKLEKQFILCDAVEDPQTGQGVYSDDSGEGENDFNEEEVTDPEAEADSNLDAEPDQNTDTTYTDNGEMETVVDVPGDTNPIDPVPVETTPVEDEENQEDDPGADSDVTDDPNWGMDDSGNSTESEGDVEEEEADDESNTEEGSTQNTPPAVEDKVLVEDGMCVMGSLASVIQKLLNVSASTAIDIAIAAMRNCGITPFPAFGANGITVDAQRFIAAIDCIDGIRVVQVVGTDEGLLLFFSYGGQAIVNTQTRDSEVEHMRHMEEYLGNGRYVYYDPTTGERGEDVLKNNNNQRDTLIYILRE